MSDSKMDGMKLRKAFSYAGYGIFLLLLAYQAQNTQADSPGPPFIGTLFEPFFVSLFILMLGGISGLIIALPLCGIYYFLVLQTGWLIVRSRWWIAVLLLLPILILLSVREFHREYQIAYNDTYRNLTTDDACTKTDAFHAYICRKVVERNVYEKTNVEHCRTLGQFYSGCIQDIVFFTKDISLCALLNQDIALQYTRSSTEPYVRDCVRNYVTQEHLTLEDACSVFDVPQDHDDCVDVFVDQTKDWSLCDRMQQEAAITRCKYYRDEYLKVQKH